MFLKSLVVIKLFLNIFTFDLVVIISFKDSFSNKKFEGNEWEIFGASFGSLFLVITLLFVIIKPIKIFGFEK